MNGSSPQLSPEDRAEIEQHKYFLSEKAGHDVGWEFAEQDWKANIAEHAEPSSSSAGETPDSGGIGTLFKRLLAKVGVL